MKMLIVDDEGNLRSVDFWESFTKLLESEEHQFWVETGKLARFEKEAFKEWQEKEEK